jgi:hypothetical protein
MLAKLEQQPERMLLQMIRHHRELFLRELWPAGRSFDDATEHELLRQWHARRKLSRIESARSWRWLAPVEALTRSITRDRSARGGALTPSERLAEIESSLPYRALVTLKRTSLHRAYARLRYGVERPAPGKSVAGPA